MPGKHVRFAREGRAYATAPTPSPYSSFSSLPSSMGPATPPQTSHFHHLHRSSKSSSHHPHASVTKGPPSLHPLLVVSKPRAANYDLSQHYSRITTAYASLSSRNGLLSEPAVSPPTSHMTISSPHLPWRVVIRPMLNGAYITVQDVLRAIYYMLRTNVSSSEFNALGRTEMHRVSLAYQERYRRLRSRTEAAEEKQGGVKRVDYLMGRTKFSGLSWSGTRSDSWSMHIS